MIDSFGLYGTAQAVSSDSDRGRRLARRFVQGAPSPPFFGDRLPYVMYSSESSLPFLSTYYFRNVLERAPSIKHREVG